MAIITTKVNLSKFKFIRRLKEKNWKADRQAWKHKWKERLAKWKPYMIVISWYTVLFYIFVGFLFNNYSWKTVLFAFSLYFVYEKLRDDYIEVQELKTVYEKESKK